MAIINDPDNLSQGAITNVTDAVFSAPTGAEVAIDSAGAGLPAVTVGMFFEIRNHSTPMLKAGRVLRHTSPLP